MNSFPPGFKPLAKFIRGATKRYYRSYPIGLENIPEGPCLFVGNHNAITVFNPEIWIFGSHYFKNHSKLKALGHDLVTRVPGVAALAKNYLRFTENTHENAHRCLNNGDQLIVFPGGGWESCRPFVDRNHIDFKGRFGFISVAKKAGVPIVPIVSTGAHSGLFIFSRGEKIAKALKFNEIFRVDTFPIGLSFPFGVHIGPFWPFFPLPSKVTLEVMKPIEVSDLEGESDSEKALSLIKRMQNVMDDHVRGS